MSKLIAKYENGNYTVRLFDNGTKIRMNDLDNLTPDFAESMDVSVTTCCNGKCQYCYLNCTEQGKHANLNNPILETVHAGTEMAINLNDLSHPDLENFLIRMKDKGVIVNATINQKHIKQHLNTLKDWQDRHLLWGIGISLTNSNDNSIIEANEQLKNVVVHIIDGCFSKEDIENLSDHNIKLLVLGFKHKGRGIEYYNQHKDEVNNNINFLKEHLMDYKSKYNSFGFDNLAIEDLEIQKKVSPEQWKTNHMGDEGEFTMYVDLCNNQYAVSSMETENIFDIKETDTVDTIFHHIRHIVGFEY